jgi:hypothetical protein
MKVHQPARRHTVNPKKEALIRALLEDFSTDELIERIGHAERTQEEIDAVITVATTIIQERQS